MSGADEKMLIDWLSKRLDHFERRVEKRLDGVEGKVDQQSADIASLKTEVRIRSGLMGGLAGLGAAFLKAVLFSGGKPGS